MKLLFIENRQQTLFWDEIASRLEQAGHDVSWIIQNPMFLPASGKRYSIPFPNRRRRSRENPLLSPEQRRVAMGDRSINYFGGNPGHYPYYAQQISAIIDEVEPDLMIGEATLFHERLAIEECKRRGIRYLFPTSCRYPPGRFAFFEYDTLRMAMGSGEVLPDEHARTLLAQIRSRRATPLYMRSAPAASLLTKTRRRVINDTRILIGRMRGERYNTPSPFRKAALQLALRRRLAAWNQKSALHRAIPGRYNVLFPLQMQPEANLDVWGVENRNQTDLLARMLEATDEDVTFVVKPNPKAKYELTTELLNLVDSNKRIRIEPIAAKMDMLFQEADLVVTVTGTVAMEGVFHGKPTVVMSQQMKHLVPGAKYLKEPSMLGDFIKRCRDAVRQVDVEEDGLRYLQWLVAHSHRGTVANPYSNPACITPENLEDVLLAFYKAIELSDAHRR